ncbi:D-methionine transport system permease protein [Haloactinopolyspora alba]|uniref:D-methionine transport system permease protein n=1 Tax=Haloactinopolyspora alba TaxID=648780 RepID=A0A2P8DPP5_9ACTN|nr:methionine ABC transporter permease [Haloactinopolyspora alba]PSK99182.1 D-methionine transport system permease protein [Haloactinopolyspora alba]
MTGEGWDRWAPELWQATLETLAIVGIAGVVTVLLGLPLGVALSVTGPGGLTPSRTVSRVLGAVVDIGRSIPFIILMIAIVPFTRLVVGTTIGSSAAAVPLTVAAIPFFARLVEAALREVSPGVVDAGASMGASRRQLIVKVLVPEALPSIVAGLTVTVVAMIGYTAMAGAVGGGGLGELAVSYGYHRFETGVTWVTVAILVVVVKAVQTAGDLCARRLSHR